eukprot:SAG11_NODE_6462_length_1308_cov_5.559140_2_plen_33_part_01
MTGGICQHGGGAGRPTVAGGLLLRRWMEMERLG